MFLGRFFQEPSVNTGAVQLVDGLDARVEEAGFARGIEAEAARSSSAHINDRAGASMLRPCQQSLTLVAGEVRL
jgi:hypothetical protein